MDEPSPWKKLSEKVVYQNRWIKVREDQVVTPSGSDGIYSVIESNDSVVVIAMNDNNEIYIIKNFRYPHNAWMWILPGGGGDQQHALEASKRELEEETGIVAKQWHKLGTISVCDGLMTEKQTVYLARKLAYKQKHKDADEPIADSKFVSLEALDRMIATGEFVDGQAISALYLLKLRLAKAV